MLYQKRVLICSFIAIASGLFGGYIGGQISITSHTQQCQNQPWGIKNLCQAWVVPRSLWQGSFTGWWTGITLGAFIGGLATRQVSEDTINDSSSLDIKEQQTLRHLLMLLAKTSANTSNSQSIDLETQSKLTPTEACQMLLKLGFSQSDIKQALQELSEKKGNNSNRSQ